MLVADTVCVQQKLDAEDADAEDMDAEDALMSSKAFCELATFSMLLQAQHRHGTLACSTSSVI